MIGRTVAGRYQIDSQLGVGGMGIVFKAQDTKLRRDVALKVIAPHLVQDEEARARFLREAQALAGLSHPNIVTVFDLAEDPESETVFIVMELLTGKPLRKRITDPTRPPFSDMAVQVCRALECAHSKGILHRDIKPENIFVCDDGTIKLMDFGLARLVDSSNVSNSGLVTGTVAYMSPEQLRGATLDPRSDLYSLGVLFYEYLCGFTPFHSDNTGTTLLKHLTEPPPSLRAKVPTVSVELEALILRLMAKEPSGRYPSAYIVRDSLERLRASGNSTASTPRLAGPETQDPTIPLVVPKLNAPRGFYIPRRIDRASRNVWRIVAVLSVLLLGAGLVFAFGETGLRMLLNQSDPPKKTVVAKKKPHQTAKQSPGHRRSTGKTRRSASRSAARNLQTASDSPDGKATKPQASTPDTGADAADGTKEETPTDSKAENTDSSTSGGDSETKNDSEPNG